MKAEDFTWTRTPEAGDVVHHIDRTKFTILDVLSLPEEPDFLFPRVRRPSDGSVHLLTYHRSMRRLIAKAITDWPESLSVGDVLTDRENHTWKVTGIGPKIRGLVGVVLEPISDTAMNRQFVVQP